MKVWLVTGVHMKISVDPSRCYGSYDCVHRVPSVFTMVDGYVAVMPGREDAGGDPEVREAAMWCPSQAITVVESASGQSASGQSASGQSATGQSATGQSATG